MKKNFWFLENWQEVEILWKFNEKFIVKWTGRIINNQEDYEWEQDNYIFVDWEQIVDKVYNNILETPSIKEYNEKIKNLEEELKNKQRELNSFLEKFNKFEYLNNLQKFVAKQIPSHYVILKSACEIVEFEKFKETNGNRNPKILSLHCQESYDNKMKFEWRTHDYNDFSKDFQNVIPCFSVAEAQEELQKYIDKKIDINTDLNIIYYKEKFPFLSFPKDYIEKYVAKKQALYEWYIKENNYSNIRYEEEIKKYASLLN